MKCGNKKCDGWGEHHPDNCRVGDKYVTTTCLQFKSLKGKTACVTTEMLTAAMEMAVKTGMFPKQVPLDKYSENWKCMELMIEAALKVRQP